jgi:hypothetical protein
MKDIKKTKEIKEEFFISKYITVIKYTNLKKNIV